MNSIGKYNIGYNLNGNIKNKSDVSAEDYIYSKAVPNALEFIL